MEVELRVFAEGLDVGYENREELRMITRFGCKKKKELPFIELGAPTRGASLMGNFSSALDLLSLSCL